MPQPETGNSYFGRVSSSAMGAAGMVPNNGYLEVQLPIPTVPQFRPGGVTPFILAQCRSISEASPTLWITYVRFIDDHTIGVWWRNTTGGALAIPQAEYDLLLFY